MLLSPASLAALTALQFLAGITTPVPRTSDPARHFPAFAAQKAEVGPIAVVADLAEFEVENGKPSRVYVENCRAFGARLAEGLAGALAAKGYAARALPPAGVGLGADEAKACRVYGDWTQRDVAGKSVPVAAAPFYTDSALAGTEERRAAWVSVMRAVWTFKLPNPKKGGAAPITGADSLREAIGGDWLLVAVGRGTMQPAPSVQWAPPTGFGRHEGPAPVVVGRGTGDSPWPGSQVRIALIDCRSGRVVWADRCRDANVLWEENVKQGFSNGRVDGFVRDLVSAMP